MKIRKCIQKNDYWFYYENAHTFETHGLYNDFYSRYPVAIGYNYNNKRKGFWVKFNKI